MFPKNVDSLYVGRVLTIGAAVATVFGTFWVVSGIQASHAPAWFRLPLTAALALVALRMALSCIRLVSSASLFPPSGDRQAMKRAASYINIATVIQIVASIAAPILLSRSGHAGVGFAAVIVTVGLYLIAFAPLVRVPHYYVVGGLLTVIPVLSILLLPATVVVATGTIQVWTALTGIACGLLYLAFGWANLLLTARIRRGQHHHNRSSQAAAIQ